MQGCSHMWPRSWLQLVAAHSLTALWACLGGEWNLSRPVRLVLRSGCYPDSRRSPLQAAVAIRGPDSETGELEEAIEVWGAVISVPEPGLAILGFGRRDVPHDLELPVPRLVKTPGPQPPIPLRAEASIAKLMDQHAFLKVSAEANLKVGDLVGCGSASLHRLRQVAAHPGRRRRLRSH